MKDTVNAFARIFTVEGAAEGVLAGTTFCAKDVFDVAGHVTGCGNPAWAASHDAASDHAPAVRALLEAGSTLVGKAHTDELAYSLIGKNAHYGTPVNSADPRRVPGGSSSGSAAAVAAGLVDLGLGSDTGGSVRLPASFCGLWGIRSTFGAIPMDGALPFTRSFDTAGWFARDGETMVRAARAYGCPASPAPTRALLPVDIWACAEPATVAALGPALALFQERMGPLAPVLLAAEGLPDWREVFRICQAAEIWELLGGWVSSHDPDFGPGVRERFEAASRIDAETAAEARRRKARIEARMAEVVTPGTVLLMPTSPAPAPLLASAEAMLDDFRARAFAMLCPAGLAGLPQLSVPGGVVDGGPVGLSLVGTKGADLALIELARDAGIGKRT